MTILELITLILPIPLASYLLSTILINRFAAHILLYLCVFLGSVIYGQLYQLTLLFQIPISWVLKFSFCFLEESVFLRFPEILNSLEPEVLLSVFVPIMIYSNENLDKSTILSENKDKAAILDPFFVTGFSDAESNFLVSIRENKENKIGWRAEFKFQISLHLKDYELLKEIQTFLKGIGNITFQKGTVNYHVIDNKSLMNVIIPHFDKYPLQSAKKFDYEL